MPDPVNRKTIRKTLNNFRLALADEIFRNAINPQLVKEDMPSHHHIAELCDDYSIRSLINWIGTRYGFVEYTKAIQSANDPCTCFLECLPGLSNQYPFVTSQEIISPETGIAIAEQFLSEMLTPHPELPGTLYELICASPLAINGCGDIDIKKTQSRRSVGQFYTPPWVVRLCLERAAADNPPEISKFLDPSCGTGNFLVGFTRLLRKRGLKGNALAKAAGDSIYGIEIDGKAASLARIAIFTSLLGDFEQSAVSMMSSLIDKLQRHIIVSDSVLAGAIRQDDPAPHTPPWLTNTQFDLVATNPPYISFGSRNQPKKPDSWSKFLRQEYPSSAEYKIRLHSIFQEVCLRFAKSGGHVALLVPDAFLTGRYYEKLRLKLLETTKIKALIELPDNIIGNATVGSWCISVYEKVQTAKNYLVDLYSIAGPADGKLPETCFKLPLDILVSKDRSRFRLLFNEMDRNIINSLDGLAPLGRIVKGHTGLRSRYGQSKIVSGESLGRSWKKGIASGSRVKRHAVSWDRTWLNIDPDLLFAGGFNRTVVENTKLMVRQTGDRLIAAVDISGLYHLNNVHSFSTRSEIDHSQRDTLIFFLAGLLNSSLFLYLYQLKAREAGRKLAQIDIETVESMPSVVNQASVSAIARLAKQIRICRGHASEADSANNHIRLLERSIDSLVYDLYPLTGLQVLYIEDLVSARLPYRFKLPQSERALSIANGVNE